MEKLHRDKFKQGKCDRRETKSNSAEAKSQAGRFSRRGILKFPVFTNWPIQRKSKCSCNLRIAENLKT